MNFKKLFHNDAASGVLLLFVALIALCWANSPFHEAYSAFIHFSISGVSLHHAVNDGLMVLFFYYVGLEIKKQIFKGELSDPKKSSFAIFAAVGGMVFPAAIYAHFNPEPPLAHGWGIPMATDIAFAVGVLALLGNRISNQLKVFLLALAIVDDLGAVLVIALFYTENLYPFYLMIALLPLAVVYFSNNKQPLPRSVLVIIGVLVWYLILKSGIHATIAGVILAFLTPFEITKNNRKHTSLDTWIYNLHPYVNFVIMPIFAFFNAGVYLGNVDFSGILHNTVSQGIILGLFLGKPLGIFITCFISTRLKIATLPQGVSWAQIFGIALVAGIGFTMSLFVSNLSFSDPSLQIYSKSGILIGSLLSGVLGYFFLNAVTRKNKAAA